MTRIFPALAALMISAAPAVAERVSVLVFDASGSMWNRVEGDLTRIEVARDVMGDYFASRDAAVPLSVIAYGHNRRGDCGDIEVIASMGQTAPATLESRLRGLMPRGMTPLTDSLALARDQIPPTAEAADIILVTDGLETCEGDPCALAASLASEGIDIRAHVVGFGLSAAEVAALSCITDQTGGMLFQANSGAELAQALQQVSMVPAVEPEPEQPARAAAFDIGDKAEAGFDYRIRWNGEATNVDFMGFVPQGESRAPASPSYRTIGGTGTAPNNPATRTAPAAPGMYDLILVTARDGVIARQAVEVVAPSMGFDPIGSVAPGSRMRFTFRGPEQLGERIVIADPDQPVNEHQRYGWDNALSKKGATTLTVPTVPGEYELRYLNNGATEIMFSRRFGVGIPFADSDLTTSAELAALAATATQADASQDNLALVTATFRLPPDVLQSDVTWQAVPLDPDLATGPWAPSDIGPVITGSFEPGNWRITATAPGEVTLSADVAIFPGQVNDFTVQIDESGDEDHGALDLQGPWRIMTVPPHNVPPGTPTDPMKIMDVVLEINASANGYQGRFTPAPAAFGTVLFEREIDSVVEDNGALIVTMALPMVEPAPFVLSVMPFAEGYAGKLVAGANSMPVVFWPEAVPLPPSTRLQVVLHGPNPADQGSAQLGVDTVFTCAQAVCAWTDPATGLTLPLPIGWSVTAPEFATASAMPTATDLPGLSLFGPEGQELRLNPRQWVDSNGTCLETNSLGRLCHFADADITAQMVAGMVAPMIHLGQPAAGEQTRPVSLTLPGVARDVNYDLEITLVDGEDERHARGQRFFGAMSLQDQLLGVGNVYDIRAVSGTREYRDRNVMILSGSTVQDVVLAPVFLWDEVSLELPDAPIVAEPGAYFPVTLTAPADFNGSIAIHDAVDRDAPAIFSIFGTELMGAQDPALPVPARPGFYEIQFLDMNGEMFGGIDLEVAAGGADHGNAAPQGPVSLALLSDRDLLAGSGGYFPVDIVAPAGLAGQLQIEAQGGAVVFSTALGPLITSQDPSLPIPDAPGIYLISIVDQAGILRATTGFEVTGSNASPTTSTSPEQIEITPIGATQFGTGCFISARLTGPAGPDYRMTIPVRATANGQDLRGVIDPEKPLAFDIYSFGSTGQSMANLMLLAACADIALDYGPPECRFAEGDGTALRDCPAPVTINAMRPTEDDAALKGPVPTTAIASEALLDTADSVIATQPPPPPGVPGSRPSRVIVTEGTAPPDAVDLRVFLPLSSEEVDAALAELARDTD